MIDLHCHLLPAVDDGPTTMDEAVAMARAFAEAGTTAVAVTPHVSWDYPETTPAAIAGGVAEVRAALAEADVALEVLPGAEIALSRANDLAEEDLEAFTLGDGPWLLVEPPFSPSLAGIEAVLDALLLRGHKLVLAHPERSPALAKDPERLRPYVDAGVLCQITAGSVTGEFGRTVQRAARRMIDDELAHLLASDAHDVTRRIPGMRGATAALQDDELADWLTREVPGAIVTGAPIPPRPETDGPRRGGLLGRLRRR